MVVAIVLGENLRKSWEIGVSGVKFDQRCPSRVIERAACRIIQLDRMKML
jgi:hypothetical protein